MATVLDNLLRPLTSLRLWRNGVQDTVDRPLELVGNSATLQTTIGGRTKLTIRDPGTINICDPPYNAKGDGVTDDTAAIQAALDFGGATGGYHVLCPTGSYLVTGLTVPENTRLVGAGIDKTTIKINATTGITGITIAANAIAASVERLTLSNVATDATGSRGIYALRSSKLHLEHVVVNSFAKGIEISGITMYLLARNVHFSGNKAASILGWDLHDGLRGCEFHNCAGSFGSLAAGSVTGFRIKSTTDSCGHILLHNCFVEVDPGAVTDVVCYEIESSDAAHVVFGVTMVAPRVDVNTTATAKGVRVIDDWTNGVTIVEPYLQMTSVAKTYLDLHVPENVRTTHDGFGSGIMRTSQLHLQSSPAQGEAQFLWSVGYGGVMLRDDSNSSWIDFHANNLKANGNLTVAGSFVAIATAAPTTGAHYAGELVLNANAASGQPGAWQCSASGTPGTWVVAWSLP